MTSVQKRPVLDLWTFECDACSRSVQFWTTNRNADAGAICCAQPMRFRSVVFPRNIFGLHFALMEGAEFDD